MQVNTNTLLIKTSLILYSLFVFTRNSVGMAIPMKIWFVVIAVSILLMLVVFTKTFQGSIPIYFLGMIYIALISLIYNNQDFAHDKFVDYLVILIPIFYSLTLAHNNEWHELFKKILIFVGLFYSFWTILCAINIQVYDSFILPFLRTYQPGMGRGNFTCGFTTHYSTNGMYIALGTIVLLGKVLTYRECKKRLRFVDILSFCTLLIGLLLCGKRGIILCVLMSFCIAYLFEKPEIDRTAKLMFLLLAVCLIIYVSSLWMPNLLVILERFKTQASSGDLLTGRLDIWKQGWDSFLASPLFGHGWGWFRYNNNFGLEFHAHNCYLQWLCELGMVFSLPIFIFIFGTFFKVLRTYRNLYLHRNLLTTDESVSITFVFMFYIYFLFFMFEGTAFYEMQCILPFYLNVAIFYFLNRKIKRGCTINEDWNTNVVLR